MKLTPKLLLSSRLTFGTLVISVGCQVVGLLVILGWLFDLAYLKSVIPGFVTMKMNTAVCFLLSGMALRLLLWQPRTPRSRGGVLVCAALVGLLGLLTLLQYGVDRDFGIDQLLIQQAAEPAIAAPPGRMSPPTAMVFFLLGSALFLHGRENRRSKTAAQLIAFMTAIIPLIGLLGYLFNSNPFYQIAAFSSMALHTAVMGLLLCLGTLWLVPDQGLMASFTSSHSGGVMARRLLPFVIGVPVLVGWLRLLGQSAGYYDTIFGIVLVVTSLILTFVVILWLNARSLNQVDVARVQAESELRESEERLRLATEVMRIGTWDRDLTSNKLFWSPSMERLMGFAPGTFPGTYEAFAPLVHPEDRWVLAAAQQQARNNSGHYQAELRFILRDGQVRWGLVNGQMLFDTQGKPLRMVGVDIDITERKHIEEALRESEERFRTLVEQASDAFFVHDTGGNFLDVNQHACESLGYSREELLQMNVFEVEADVTRAQAEAAWAQVQAGQASTLYGHQRRRDGTLFPVEVRWSCFDFQGKRLFLDLVRDITERERYERELTESKARLVGIISSAMDAIIAIDEDQRITLFNAAAEKMFGCSAAEAVGQSIERFIPERFRHSHHEHVKEFGRTNVSKRAMGALGAIYGLRAKGTEFPIEASISQIVVSGRKIFTIILRDITEREQAEEAQRKSQRRHRELAESLPQLIWTCVGEGTCDYLSPQWVAYTGRPAREQLGYGWLEQVHPDDREATAKNWALASERTRAFDGEFRIRRFDGIYHWFRTRAVPICDEQGRLLKWFGSNTDIEDIKQAQENVERLNKELEQRVALRTDELAAANRELEAFAYSVSHDLRAPLRAIDGFSRILVEDYGPNLVEDAAEYLQLVRENTQRMGQLIDDLLNLSRLNRQAFNPQRIDPAAIVRAVLAELEHECQGRQIELTMEELPSCDADVRLLKQVYVNLLTNAFKFTKQREVAHIKIGCLKAEDSAPIYFVQDNGVGFDMKYTHKLFQVFQRLHRAEDYEGTGVGLAIVHRIIQRHGGRIWVESALNQGATFYFTLAGGIEA